MVAVVSADFAAVTAEVLSEACDACAVLQKHDKTAITHVAPLQPVPTPTAAWEKLAVDIVGAIQTAPPDCRFAITLDNYYSRWPEMAFCSAVPSMTVKTFLATVFSKMVDDKW